MALSLKSHRNGVVGKRRIWIVRPLSQRRRQDSARPASALVAKGRFMRSSEGHSRQRRKAKLRGQRPHPWNSFGVVRIGSCLLFCFRLLPAGRALLAQRFVLRSQVGFEKTGLPAHSLSKLLIQKTSLAH